PVVVFSYSLFSTIGEDIAVAANEKAGNAFLQPTFALLQHVQQHRGASSAMLAGNRSFQDDVQQKQQAIAEDIQAVDRMNKQYGKRYGVHDEWQRWKQDWQALRSNLLQLSPQQSFEQHTALIERLLGLQQTIADASQMTLDPEQESYYAMYAFALVLPATTEHLGRARAVGTAAIAAGDTSKTRDKLIALSSLIYHHNQEEVVPGIEKVFQVNRAMRSQIEGTFKESCAKVDAFINMLNTRLINGDLAGLTAQQYFDTATQAIDSQFVLIGQMSRAFDRLMDARIRRLTFKRNMMLSAALVPFLVAAWLYGGFYLSVRRRVHQIAQISQKLSVGNLQVDIATTDSKEEMNQISRSLAGVLQYMRQLADASQHIARGDLTVQIPLQSEQDMLGTSFAEMARSLRRIVGQLRTEANQLLASAHQMGTAAQQSTQASSDVARGSEQLAQQAGEAAQAMDSLDRAIRSVQQSSQTQREA
ncbi:MAG: nitrate- and nitrite sensing domain-containing protein, partial [bacterium]|nr:nitrate- and nitrite sensing domain-containing protein [bacterium]